MKLKRSDFNIIKELLDKKVLLRGSTFINNAIIKRLKLNGTLVIKRLSPQRYKNILEKESNLFLFFKSVNYNIKNQEDIEHYITEVLDKNASRDTIQKITNNTKTESSKSLRGLYLSSIEPVAISINNQKVLITPTDGLGYFCFYTERVDLSREIVVVGVENYQVVWFAKRYRELFKRKNLLFVVRNLYMLEWIGSLENEYIHFGDYDLAGIHIYLNEIVPRLKNSKSYSMFIPENIEELIKQYGNRELFEKQKRYLSIEPKETSLIELKKIILKYKKGLEQEGLSKRE